MIDQLKKEIEFLIEIQTLHGSKFTLKECIEAVNDLIEQLRPVYELGKYIVDNGDTVMELKEMFEINKKEESNEQD